MRNGFAVHFAEGHNIKVTIISNTPPLSMGAGTGYTARSIATYFKNRGLGTSILSISTDEGRDSIDGIELLSFRRSALPNFSWSLLKHILTNSYDRYIVISPDFITILLCWIRSARIVLIPQWHDSFVFRNLFTSFFYRFKQNFFDYPVLKLVQPKVVCYTERESSYLRRFVKDIAVIPLGLDLNRPLWRLYESSAPATKQKDARLLFVGRVVDHKFPLFIIEVLKLCCKEFRGRFVFHVVGPIDGTYMSTLQRRLKDTGFTNRVVFTGPVSEKDLAGYYKNADVFVFPSISESFGYTLVEALYAGLPIVATRVGIAPYLEKQGLIMGINYGDAKGMTEKIYKSYKDSDMIKKRLLKSRKSIGEMFNMESFLKALYNIVVRSSARAID